MPIVDSWLGKRPKNDIHSLNVSARLRPPLPTTCRDVMLLMSVAVAAASGGPGAAGIPAAGRYGGFQAASAAAAAAATWPRSAAAAEAERVDAQCPALQ